MADRRVLRVVVTGDTDDLTKALKKAGAQVDDFGESTGKLGGKFKGASIAAGGFLAGIAGSQLIDFGKDLFATGQRLDTMAKKAETVFGDSLDQVQRWANGTAHSFGLTKRELTGLAANFGDLVKPMGFTSQQAADMSTDVLNLAGALSAWTGGQRSATDVAETLTKAMLGEREQLKGLGISISEADVQQRLLENGQKELTGAALEQAKALATLQLITEKSTDAQAFWASGAADNTKKMNELKAKLAEVQEELAAKLYPIFVAVGTWLVDVGIPKAEAFAAKVGEITGKVKEWFTESEDGQQTLEIFRVTIQGIADALQQMYDILGPVIKGVGQLVEKAGGLGNVLSLGKSIGGFGGLGGLGGLIRREVGGPVRAGQPYIVGEKRPELFVPDVNGMILPSVPSARGGMVAAGGGTTIIVQGSVISERELLDVVRRAERRGLSFAGV